MVGGEFTAVVSALCCVLLSRRVAEFICAQNIAHKIARVSLCLRVCALCRSQFDFDVQGELNGSVGLFPSNYVEPCKEPPKPRAAAPPPRAGVYLFLCFCGLHVLTRVETQAAQAALVPATSRSVWPSPA